MQPFISNNQLKIGILGGGQLGKMLTDAARRYDLFTKVLDPAADAPAAFSCKSIVQGSFQDYDTVMGFCTDCEVVTIEIENVNVKALADLEAAGKKVFPQAHIVSLIQNKISQKQFYAAHDLPTAPFFAFDDKAGLMEALQTGKLTLPFVWKAAMGGYDGRGVVVVKTEDGLKSIPDVAGLAEEMADIQVEIAVAVARNQRGEVAVFPAVEMEFHPEANQVEYVFCPAALPAETIDRACEIALSLADEMQIVGLLAIELFVNKDGTIWINESAPRVHNSAHLSIESWATSQFEQHLRAILGFPLGDTSMLHPAVMVNLVGAPGFSGPVYYEGAAEVLKLPGAYMHIYGKSETRPFRKMGHITLTGKSVSDAKEKAMFVKETIKVISTV